MGDTGTRRGDGGGHKVDPAWQWQIYATRDCATVVHFCCETGRNEKVMVDPVRAVYWCKQCDVEVPMELAEMLNPERSSGSDS